MTEMTPPIVASDERKLQELRQVTVHADEQIKAVNELLGDGWRLVSVGYQAEATVYVLGRSEEKQRHRTGFGFVNSEQ